MKKKKNKLIYVLFLAAVLVFAIYKAPALIKTGRVAMSDRWESFRLAWKQKNYKLAYRQLDVNCFQLLLVRRPAQFLYWKAEALERLGENDKAAKVRKKLLKCYPLDYYAFLVVPETGGITSKNCTKFIEKNAKKFPMPFKTEVAKASKKTNINAALIWAIMKRESKFNPAAVSSSGAIGVMQIMPDTANYIAEKERLQKFDLRVPADNIMIGSYDLKNLLSQFNDELIYTIAAYNAGASNIRLWMKNKESRAEWVEDIPYPETREFVRCVVENYSVYKLKLQIKN